MKAEEFFYGAVCALKSVYALELKADFSKQIGVYSKNNCTGHCSGKLFPANGGLSGDAVLVFLMYFWN